MAPELLLWSGMLMSRFYFDTNDDDLFFKDHEGQELPDKEAARKAGLAALPDMARDHMPDGDRRTFFVAVRDDKNNVIYKATLALVGGWHSSSS